MSVEQAIHERWPLWKPLEDLLPVARVTTGRDAGTPALPYCSLERMPGGTSQRTSSSMLEAVNLRFHLYGETLDSIKPVAAAIKDHFNKLDFPYSLGKVLDCRPIGPPSEFDDEGGIWHIEYDFLFRTSEEI